MNDDLTTILQKEFSDKKLQVDETVPEFQGAVEKDNKENGENHNPEDIKGKDEKSNPDVLSNTDSPKDDKKTEVKNDVKVPSFEELLAERTEGKFKTWDELQTILNEPKTEFANEQMKKINDYVKNGGTFDKDWFYYQTKMKKLKKKYPVSLKVCPK